jgi:ferritin-like metal-binding protein YciE
VDDAATICKTEDQETMPEQATPEVINAALIAAAQRIEYYEIAGYGTAVHYAEHLDHTPAADLLRQTLEEEQLTDAKLNELAKSYINQEV